MDLYDWSSNVPPSLGRHFALKALADLSKYTYRFPMPSEHESEKIIH
jgi:hypothetical protein